jgi:hypothetical protein
MNLIELWYSWTTPPEPGTEATIEQRIQVNRARQASLLLFWLILAAIFPIPTAIQQKNMPLLIILLVTITAYLVAMFLNRMGHPTVAGIITMVLLEGGFLSALLSLQATGGTSLSDLPTLMLLVESSIVGAAFFTPRITILVTIFNCFIAFAILEVLPKSSNLVALMKVDGYDIISRPIILFIIVGVSVASISNGFIGELRRANRAEEIATLERREVERQNEQIALNAQLESGIQQVLETLNAVANGQVAARARIGQNNVLFRVGYSVNNLLARLQGYQAERAELEKTRKVAEMIVIALREQQPLPFSDWTGTSLDPIIMQLKNSAPSSSERHPPSDSRMKTY